MYFQSACFAIDSASVTASHSPSHDDVYTQAVLSLSTQSFPSLFLNLALTKHLAEHQTDLALLLFSGSVLVEVLNGLLLMHSFVSVCWFLTFLTSGQGGGGEGGTAAEGGTGRAG